jgi:enamine deaminase RidA (YjgF/YER057c/UK114 family)
LFATATGIKVNAIPYRGSAPALTDVAAGQVDAHFATLASGSSLLGANRISALMVTGNTRLAGLPEVPTAREAGMDSMQFNQWWALVAPATTPIEIVERLRSEAVAALAHPSTRERLTTLGHRAQGFEPRRVARLHAQRGGPLGRRGAQGRYQARISAGQHHFLSCRRRPARRQARPTIPHTPRLREPPSTKGNTMSAYDKLKALNITLPPVATPAAAYLPFVQTGNLVFLSGHIAKKDGKVHTGQLGKNMSTEEGKAAARAVAIDLMGTLEAAVGLGKVKRIVKLMSLVNSTGDYTEQHLVTNGASELFAEIFGDAGKHARSAFGVAQIPMGACVEIELIAEVG